MAVIVNECPIVLVVDGIISFLQYLFSSPEITPDEYRWSEDEKSTRIFISAPYTITREKTGGLPTITVSRGPLMYENRVIDNLKSADANMFENPEYRDILHGTITIVCEAGTASEAAGLASFVSLEIQSNRKALASNLGFLHRIVWYGISPETPVEEKAEVVRWQCSATFDVALYIGWITRVVGTFDKFNKFGLRASKYPNTWSSIYGQITAGLDTIVDPSANFGFSYSNKPQFLVGEYNKKWYFITIEDDATPYRIEEIVDSKTLKLSRLDEKGNYVPFNPRETKTNVHYRLHWNVVHLSIELPKRRST